MVSEIFIYLVSHWFSAFLLTLIIEVPVYMLMTKNRIPLWRSAFGAIACSAITHPLLWFVWRDLFSDYNTFVISGEILVVIIESAVFFTIARPPSLGHAIAASCIANALSYGVGVFIQLFAFS